MMSQIFHEDLREYSAREKKGQNTSPLIVDPARTLLFSTNQLINQTRRAFSGSGFSLRQVLKGGAEGDRKCFRKVYYETMCFLKSFKSA